MLQDYPYRIILGSASPRRKELMNMLDVKFEVFPINSDESFTENLISEEIPLFLSEKKSNAFPRELKENELLITSDTIVWHRENVLNKPANYKEAFEMLSSLSGEIHTVYTGVCIRTTKITKLFVDSTDVYFRVLEKEEIEYYLENYNPYDKAGAYGAQDWIGQVGVERIEGSYFNVMGLPVHKVYSVLKEIIS
ncbi:MAG: Maf family nucleotide pyrophosphatase [Bacteroidota bacterium]|jgi:septum formation protein